MEELLITLADLGVQLEANGNSLEVKDPDQKLTNGTLAKIREHESELLMILESIQPIDETKSVQKAQQKSHYALSSAQKRMHFLYEFDKSSLAYNMPYTLELKGVLDKSRMENAFEKLIMRHESLRTSFFVVEHEVTQRINDRVLFKIEHYETGRSEVNQIIKDFIRPFDLSKPHLIRVGLIRLAAESHLLLVDMHHIITDGISQGILIKDFMSLYANQDLQALSLHYKDYSEWQQEEEQRAELSNDRQFWLQQFAEDVSLLDLPTDFARPKIMSDQGGSVSFSLNEVKTSQLKKLGDKAGATMFMTVLSIFNILLSKISDKEDIVVGTPVAGRDHPDLEAIIGVFVNTLVLRNYPKGDITFESFLSDLRERALSCFDHQSFQYEELIEELNIRRDTSRNPLFDVMFVFQNFEREALTLPGLTLKSHENDYRVSKFDLVLNASESSGQLYLSMEYSTSLFTENTIKRFVDYFLHIADSILDDTRLQIAQIDPLTPEERHLLLHEYNDTEIDYPRDKKIIELFEDHVALQPDKTALVYGSRQISYRYLNERANQIAHYLRAQGVGRNDVIGIILERSADMITCVLGVIKAGAAYLPIDANAPTKRIDYYLENSRTKFVIASDSFNGKDTFRGQILEISDPKIDKQSKENPQLINEEDDLLYVIYTSGSTGLPKGTMVGHSQYLNITYAWRKAYRLEDIPVNLLQMANFSFDVFSGDISRALLNGGKMVLCPEDSRLDVKELYQILKEESISIFEATPALILPLMDYVRENNLETGFLQLLILGSDICQIADFRRLLEDFGDSMRVINSYGVTEATIDSSYYESSLENLPRTGFVPIGKPMDNVSFYLLDKYERLLPRGVAGELYIGGSGLAQGYLNNDALTSGRFISSPFQKGERIYKTGDITRWLPDGNMMFLGRVDDQVKIRGFRIELGEIEGQLLNLSQIKEVVVVAREKAGDKYLVAYYTSDDELRAEIIRNHLAERLPDYMLPSHYVYLDGLPLTSNGKVDRKSLPDPEFTEGDDYLAPATDIETKLVRIWSEVLTIDKKVIGVNKSFFELGGHSLKATKLVNLMSKELNVEVPLRTVFTHQDIRSLSEFIKQADKSVHSGIGKAATKEHYVLSAAQRRMYFLHEFDRDSLAYNMSQAVWLEGTLDSNKMENVLEKLIQRYEILRTSFELIDGTPAQIIHNQSDFKIEYFESNESTVPAIIKNFKRPFELNVGPMIRVGVIKLSTETHLLMVDMHHIITDGVSQVILIKDFMSLYNDEVLPEVTLQYKDYSEWQQAEEYKTKLTGQKEFWKQEFAEESDILDLPTDFPRPKIKSHTGNVAGFSLSQQETAQLISLGDKAGATPFITVLSIFNILLSKLTNQEDITVGTPMAGRNHSDLEDVMGMFLTTLALRNYPRKEISFESFLMEVKEKSLSCFEHQEYQYEELIEDLNISRDTSRNPLFDVMLVFQNFEQQKLSIPGLTLKSYEGDHNISKFDLTLSTIESNGQLHFGMQYSTELFKPDTIERFISYFKRLVKSIVLDPTKKISQLEILSKEEKTILLEEFNATNKDFPREKTIIDLFEQQVRERPDKTAVVLGTKRLTYNELNEHSNELALRIQGSCNGLGLVGLYVEPSLEMVISVLAVLKSGMAFLPLDPDHHSGRQETILEESQTNLLIIQDSLESQVRFSGQKILLDEEIFRMKTTQRVETKIKSEDQAYVIYTSGSTGKPKGVKISHRNLVNYITWFENEAVLDAEDKLLLTTSFAFDAIYTQFFGALLNGLELHVLSKEDYLSPQNLTAYIYQHKISVLKMTPTLLNMLLNDGSYSAAVFEHVRFIMLGGESINAHDVAQIMHTNDKIKVMNHYGPTETTIGSIAQYIEHEAIEGFLKRPTIGRPIHNTHCYILDESRKLVPFGCPGELYIGGEGVGMGYLRDEQLTSEKFVHSPFHQDKVIYKTGDRARWQSNGTIEYLGRLDDQVKLRGYRIELGDIESQLVNHSEITESVAMVKGIDRSKYIVGYYVAEKSIGSRELRAHLSQQLPDYMLPAYYVHLENIPLTGNGKLNRKALPDPEVTTEDYIAPETKEQAMLCEVWSKVLGVENIGATDNFFSVGGDSIKSIQISSRMRALGYELSVKDIFANQTIQELSLVIKESNKVSDQDLVTGTIPLTPIQQYFFEGHIESKHHFNQSVIMNFADGITQDEVRQMFTKLQNHHDALRIVFQGLETEIVQENRNIDHPLNLFYSDLRKEVDPEKKILKFCNDLHSSIDLEQGPLMHLGLFDLNDGSRLFIVLHHLIVDGLSWRILFEDIETLYQQLKGNEPLQLPLKTDSFLEWSVKLNEYAQGKDYKTASTYWNSALKRAHLAPKRDYANGTHTLVDEHTIGFDLTKSITEKLLTEVHKTFNTQINDILLAGLLLAVNKSYDEGALKIDIEGHGREEILEGIDVSRTVGWFTSLHPVFIERRGEDIAGLIKGVKESIRNIPNNGVDYLIGQYLSKNSPLNTSDSAPSWISFNYLGQFDSDTQDKTFAIASESTGHSISLSESMLHDWGFTGLITGGRLKMNLDYSEKQYKKETMSVLLSAYEESLVELIDYCCNYNKLELTPSDLTFKGLSIAKLDELQSLHPVQDIYSLSPMQEGMLFHSLLDSEAVHYFGQMSYRLKGDLDIGSIQRSFQALIDRHDILRTMFVQDGYDRPLQIVLKEREADFDYHDIREEVEKNGRASVLRKYREKDREVKFVLDQRPLIRVRVYRTAQDEYEFIWSHHHILMDGWCMSIIIKEYSALYNNYRVGTEISLPKVQPYSNFINWLETREKEPSSLYWHEYLEGYQTLATICKSDGEMSKLAPGRETSTLVLSKTETESLNSLSRQHGITLNTIIQSAWAILLSKYNGVQDVVFGSVVSGRPPELEGVETMVGLFINTIPVRIHCENQDSLNTLLSKSQERGLSSEDHHYTPLSEIQSLSGLGTDLFDHILVLENYPVAEEVAGTGGSNEDISGYSISEVENFEQNSYDLTVFIFIVGEEITIEFVYNPYRYDEDVITVLKRHLKTVLNQVITNPMQTVQDVTLETSESINQIAAQLELYNVNVSNNDGLDPVSFHQERLWFIDKFETDYLYEGSPIYHNIPLILDLEGTMDTALLEKSVQSVLNRHSALRTVILENDERPLQAVLEKPKLDFKVVTYDSEMDNINELVYKEMSIPFDLDKLLFRATLFSRNKGHHCLVVTLHHLIVDRYSVNTLSKEILLYYDALVEGQDLELPLPATQYNTFSKWQKESLKEIDNHCLSFWKPNLGHKLQDLEIPTDRPRAFVHTYTASRIEVVIDATLSEKLDDFVADSGFDREVLLMSVFNILLHKYTWQKEIVIGTSFDNRDFGNLSDVIGPISNLIPLRSFVEQDDTFVDYTAQLSELVSLARDHGYIPFDKLVNAISPEKDMSRTALFDVLFNYQEQEVVLSQPKGLKVSLVDQNYGYGKYDLNFFLQHHESGIKGSLVYNADYFDTATAERFVNHYYELLNQLLNDPKRDLSRTNVLLKEERQKLLKLYVENKAVAYPDQETVIDLFKSQVSRTPDQVAVVFEGTTVTYDELDKRSDRLGYLLRKEGVERDTIVSLLMDRSIDTIVGMLSILKAGGAYLPIDIDYPEDRISYLLKDSASLMLLTKSDLADRLEYGIKTLFIDELEATKEAIGELSLINEPSDLCYIIYTSGTTGHPKGVMVEHRNVVRLFYNEEFQFDFGPEDVWTMFHSPSFDFSVWEMYGALLYGGKLIVIPKMLARDPEMYLNTLREHGVTVLNQTPSAFYNMMTDQRDLSGLSLRYVIFGGEALSPIRLKAWKSLYPQTKLVNMFGITETTVHVTYKELTADDIEHNIKTIGRPIPTLSVYLLDAQQQLVAPGVKGELFIGGGGVTRGYLNNEPLTEQKFITNPYAPTERLYRSGDLARLMNNGELEYLGRIDDQVQLRGFRIELGEIESCLSSHEQISEAVVVNIEQEGDQYLIGYYVSATALDTSGLRMYLSSHLPDYMLPSYYVHLDKVPLTSNGKIDRKRLPSVELTAGEDYVAPRTDTERKLVEIWSEVLNIDPEVISVTQSFFELGGHSLKATLLINKISKELEVLLPLKEVFTHQDISSLAELINQSEKENYSGIQKASQKDQYSLSAAQRRMYFLYEFDKSSVAYNMPQVVPLKSIDKDLLQRALTQLVLRHEILRTRFERREDDPAQKVMKPMLVEPTYYQGEASEVTEIIKSFVQPFDLSTGPAFRVGLVEVLKSGKEDAHHFLLIDMHHIISDGVSHTILVNDFNKLYDQEELPELKLQYKDYAEWQQGTEQQARLHSKKDFWLNEFPGDISVLELPTDFKRPSISNHAGSSYSFSISSAQSKKLRTIAKGADSTMYMVFLSLYTILLRRLSTQEDIVVGTPVAGRDHADLNDMIGLFVNTLALRTHVDGTLSFTQLLLQVKSKALACFENQSYPYELLIDQLNVERDASRNPLFDVMFAYQNFEEPTAAQSNRDEVGNHRDGTTSKFDLTLTVSEQGDQFRINMTYAVNLFTKETIERFAGYLGRIISAIVSDQESKLSDIDLISSQERHQLLNEFNQTTSIYPKDKTLIDSFAAQVVRTPGGFALSHNDERVTYSELDVHSNALADHLLSVGINHGSVVGIMLDRSVDLIVAILGVLKAGGTYLPLDSNHPHARIAYMLEDCKTELLITNQQNSGEYDSCVKTLDIYSFETPKSEGKQVLPDTNCTDLCYIIYTSGSTGKPKGVEITHQSVMNLITSQCKLFDITDQDKVLQFSTITFDASVEQLWLTLLKGATLVLVDKETISDPKKFNEYIIDQGITHLHATPSYLETIELIGPNNLRRVVAGGETCSTQLARKYCEHYEFYNEYGPTETTVTTTVKRIQDNDLHSRNISIGKPISNTQILILDNNNTLQPIGVPGELCISGDGLAQGYVNNETLTREKFVDNPYDNKVRMYRTGDRARWLADGTIEYLDRMDDQVKVRGFRIELGEIKSCLAKYDDIKECAIVVKGNDNDQYLVGYYVSAAELDASDLRKHLSSHLPDYMLPSYYVHLDKIPLTSNGKVDKKRLPSVALTVGEDYVGPRTDTERKLVEVWSEVLNIDPEVIGVTRSFFELGGNSMKIITLNNKINDALGWDLSVTQIFRFPTISGLADLMINGDNNIEEAKERIQKASKGADEILKKFGY